MKRQPNFTPERKLSPRGRARGFSAVRSAALVLAVGVAVSAAAWLAHYFSPPARLARRTIGFAATLELNQQALAPIETLRRLSASEGALAPDVVVDFEWEDEEDDGGQWSLSGRREIKDCHARLLAEAPRLTLHLDSVHAVAEGRPAPDSVTIGASAGLNIWSADGGLPPRCGPLRATILWQRDRAGDWKIARASFHYKAFTPLISNVP